MAEDDLATLRLVYRAWNELDLDTVREHSHPDVWSFRDGRIAAIRSYGSWEEAAREAGL